MSYNRRTQAALVAHFGAYDRVVEVGIGRRPGVAADLAARGTDVTATDIQERSVPPGVTFVRDDITNPDHSIYRDAELVYALNLPPELHRSLVAVAAAVDADCRFSTLGGDPPAISAAPITLAEETLFKPREG